jgi:cytochrome c oxidase cbb3-type subunit 3
MDAGGRYHSWPLRSGVTVELDDPLHQHLELLHTYTDKDIHDLFAYLETLQ